MRLNWPNLDYEEVDKQLLVLNLTTLDPAIYILIHIYGEITIIDHTHTIQAYIPIIIAHILIYHHIRPHIGSGIETNDSINKFKIYKY